jgi:hypothetical protein
MLNISVLLCRNTVGKMFRRKAPGHDLSPQLSEMGKTEPGQRYSVVKLAASAVCGVIFGIAAEKCRGWFVGVFVYD